MTPQEIARATAEQINPVPFGPPEHLERIAQRRAKKVESDAALILSAAVQMVRESGVEQLVERVITGVPACDEHGQLFQMHFDEDGRELGPEYVDPLAVIQSMQGTAQAALTALRALTEHKP